MKEKCKVKAIALLPDSLLKKTNYFKRLIKQMDSRSHTVQKQKGQKAEGIKQARHSGQKQARHSGQKHSKTKQSINKTESKEDSSRMQKKIRSHSNHSQLKQSLPRRGNDSSFSRSHGSLYKRGIPFIH